MWGTEKDVVRRIFVRSEDRACFQNAIDKYSEITGRRTELGAQMLGPVQGWTLLDMPSSLHPYYFHNLGSWVAQGIDIVTSSWSAEDHWHYVLIEEVDSSEYLVVGCHESGSTLSVHRPSHYVIRGESLELPGSRASEILAAKGVPEGFAHQPLAELGLPAPLSLFPERYERSQNAGLETTHEQRPTEYEG